MDITFDPTKNDANIAKHGVSLADSDGFEWGAAVVRIDTRHTYGENRMTAIGYIGDRLHVAVFVDRGNVRRIISLRKANKREECFYAKT